MTKSIVHNLLIILGCYWLSMWFVIPISALHLKITTGIIYSGTLGVLLMYIVQAIPVAIVALGAGILCVYFLEGASPKNWLFLLAILYAVMNFTSFFWVESETIDRVFQGLQSIIPAILCYFSGTIVINNLQKKRRNG